MHAMITDILLTQAIKEAFPVSPMPRSFFQSEEDSASLLELPSDLRGRVMGKKWHEVTHDDWAWLGGLSHFRDYMTTEAYIYYVPSVLLDSIHSNYFQHGVEVVLPDNQQHMPRGEWWKDFVGSLNGKQKEAIRLFLQRVRALATNDPSSLFWAEHGLSIIWPESSRPSPSSNNSPRP
ncbi:MAG: hypothetical protein IPI58_08745 [Alphaproteobacteria bacterium]|nr:MAG: hypothetical protein IPI58_08745 [Alphaproteobacteria bacterium]